MAPTLGTMEELPGEYRQDMQAAGVTPLWPMMRNVLPHGKPTQVSQASIWRYDSVRPLLIQAGELTPVEKAERRVLVFSDPGRGDGAMQATASIYLGLQLLLPGETAPNHVHTPSAARIVVEGEGGYTTVDGEKLPMHRGDVVLTPGGEWHEHGHDGEGPVIWLDALDLPVFYYLEGSYASEGGPQSPRNRPDASEVEYLASGLRPARKQEAAVRKYPMVRYPWTRTEEALREMSKYADGPLVELDYVNPETGADALPTLGFTAVMLGAGAKNSPTVQSASAAIHIVAGRGATTINGERFEWGPSDTFSIPVFAEVVHEAVEESFFIKVHDRPLQEKLGYYEERTK